MFCYICIIVTTRYQCVLVWMAPQRASVHFTSLPCKQGWSQIASIWVIKQLLSILQWILIGVSAIRAQSGG